MGLLINHLCVRLANKVFYYLSLAVTCYLQGIGTVYVCDEVEEGQLYA